MEGRVPPHSAEAEKSVLGAAMLSKDALFDVMEVVKPADFYDENHKEIFQAMIDLGFHRKKSLGELLLSHFQTEDHHRRFSLDRGITRQRQGERRLSHGRSCCQDDQVGFLHTGRHFVQLGKSCSDPGQATVHLFCSVDDGQVFYQHIPDMRILSLLPGL